MLQPPNASGEGESKAGEGGVEASPPRSRRPSFAEALTGEAGASMRPSQVVMGARKSTISMATEEDGRAQWGSKLEFILTLVGYAVGLGNVWRFPYLAFSNGGGSFLFPYVIILFALGMPLFAFEIWTGQRFRLGSVAVWGALEPRLAGLGWSSTILSALVMLYYNFVIAVTLFYFAMSFQSPLPWDYERSNGTVTQDASRYFQDDVMDMSSSINTTGIIVPHLVICLIATWLLIYAIIYKGVETAGKVVYFTALFPYVVLFILLIRGVTLPGAWKGLKFFLVPDFTKLASAQTWLAAANQIFYSLGVGWSSLIAFGSFNPKSNDFIRDATIVPLVNAATSLFAGICVFSIAGYLAHKRGVDVESLELDGPGLAFEVYPAALAEMEAAPLFAVLFFLMLLCLGIDSGFAMAETVVTSVVDGNLFPNTDKRYIIIGVCIFGFLGGLLFTTQSGIYWLALFDSYTGAVTILLISLGQLWVIGYRYGFENFLNDAETFTGRKLSPYWRYTWMYIAPGTLVILVGAGLYSFSLPPNDGLFCLAPLVDDDHDDDDVNDDDGCGGRDVTWASQLGACGAILAMLPTLYFLALPPERKGPMSEQVLEDSSTLRPPGS